MPQDPTVGEAVAAAGAVLWRRAPDGALEVLVIHRDRYDDWTLPKGKVDPGETWEQAAVREVFEETGIVAVLGEPAGETRYVDHKGRDKVVRYFAMTVAVPDGRAPDGEVDEMRWLDVASAIVRLTYERDAEIVSALAAADRGVPKT